MKKVRPMYTELVIQKPAASVVTLGIAQKANQAARSTGYGTKNLG
jgi:hypothetical protein